MDKKELLGKLKADLASAEQMRQEQDTKERRWLAEYNGEPYGNEQDGKSAIVSRDIKKSGEWAHASILDPFVSTPDIVKVSPITYEDVEGARQAQLVLNTQFTRQFNRYGFMSKALKVLDQRGTVTVQTGWEYMDEEVSTTVEQVVTDEYGNEYIEEVESTEIVVTKNRPTAKVCRGEDVFIDPTCQDDMDNCQYVIYRYETDMSTLREDARYKNLNKVNIDSGTQGDGDYQSEDTTSAEFYDDPRKKLLVYEYWGNYDVNGDGIAEPIVCAWIGDVVIRLQSNPYPDNKPPFLVVPFNSVPFQMYGEANAELISDNQKVKTAVTRGIIDNMAQSNNGQKGIKKGALDSQNRVKFLGGKNFEFNTSAQDFWDGSYNQIPGSAFDMLSMMNNEIESITGIKSFSGGINGGSLGATATAAKGAMDATSARKMNTVRNVAENLMKPLMRKWHAYNCEFLNETEVIRITNAEFVEVRRDDMTGAIDIEIEISTAEDNASKAQELAFMLQTLGTSAEPAERRMLQAEIARLQRNPTLAHALENYQPDPARVKMEQDRHQIEMDKLRLENKMLEAQIRSEYASASEDEADRAEKLSKAKLVDAQTAKLVAETGLTMSKKDMTDLEFLKTDEEVDHSNAMQIENNKRLANLDGMVMQARLGGKSEQIGVSK